MYTFTFDNTDLEGLNAALQEAPFRVAAPIIAKINRQIAEQEQEQEQVTRHTDVASNNKK